MLPLYVLLVVLFVDLYAFAEKILRSVREQILVTADGDIKRP